MADEKSHADQQPNKFGKFVNRLQTKYKKPDEVLSNTIEISVSSIRSWKNSNERVPAVANAHRLIEAFPCNEKEEERFWTLYWQLRKSKRQETRERYY